MTDLNDAIKNAYAKVTDKGKITHVIADDLKVKFPTAKNWLSGPNDVPERYQPRVLYILNNAVKLQAQEFKEVALQGDQVLQEFERRAAQTNEG